MEPSETFLNGWHAHRLREKNEANPYDSKRQYISSVLWDCGWCERFSAVKHGLPLKYDETVF